MTLPHILVAARDRLILKFSGTLFQNDDISVQPDGQPRPDAGEWHISLHGTEWTANSESDSTIDEIMGITCTITRRISATPRDLLGRDLYAKFSVGIGDVARDVMQFLSRNYNVIGAATGTANRTIHEPLLWISTDPSPRIVGGEWFWASQDARICGLVMDVRFGDARAITPATIAEE